MKYVRTLEGARGKNAVELRSDSYLIFSDKERAAVLSMHPGKRVWHKVYGKTANGWMPEYREPYMGGS